MRRSSVRWSTERLSNRHPGEGQAKAGMIRDSELRVDPGVRRDDIQATVIPAKAGIQDSELRGDPGVRRAVWGGKCDCR